MGDHRKLLWNTAKVFAPSYPRNSSNAVTMQARRTNRGSFVAALQNASENGMPGYYSVYSFPRGHPQDENIPAIDSIFIDLDITGQNYRPDDGKASPNAWRADMSALLARSRMIARAIIEEGVDDHFRVVLSGHKGIHLYLDFPTVAESNGDLGQFKNGLSLYGSDMMDRLDDLADGVNIGPWVDVDASDLARLARFPNTRHHGVAYTDDDRWCVPITMEELAGLTVDDYIRLTSEPRPLPDGYQRVPSQNAHDKLTQYIRAAPSSSRRSNSGRRKTSTVTALKTYREETQNDAIELDDVLFLTANKPCFAAFRERDDAYDHGESSRMMELSIMGRLITMNTPVAVIHEFFEPIPGYDEDTTDNILADLLARGNEYGEFQCSTIVGGINDEGARVPAQAEEFCLKGGCDIYRRSDDLR